MIKSIWVHQLNVSAYIYLLQRLTFCGFYVDEVVGQRQIQNISYHINANNVVVGENAQLYDVNYEIGSSRTFVPEDPERESQTSVELLSHYMDGLKQPNLEVSYLQLSFIPCFKKVAWIQIYSCSSFDQSSISSYRNQSLLRIWFDAGLMLGEKKKQKTSLWTLQLRMSQLRFLGAH